MFFFEYHSNRKRSIERKGKKFSFFIFRWQTACSPLSIYAIRATTARVYNRVLTSGVRVRLSMSYTTSYPPKINNIRIVDGSESYVSTKYCIIMQIKIVFPLLAFDWYLPRRGYFNYILFTDELFESQGTTRTHLTQVTKWRTIDHHQLNREKLFLYQFLGTSDHNNDYGLTFNLFFALQI